MINQFFRQLKSNDQSAILSTDNKLLEELERICSCINLGGNTYDLSFNRKEVVQITSTAFNIQHYAIPINDINQIKCIIEESKSFEAGFHENLGAKFEDLEIGYGLLVVYRMGFLEPEKSNNLRVKFYDFHVLNIYLTDHSVPIIRVYRDSVGLNRNTVDYQSLRNILEHNVGVYQRPDEVIVDWHQMAEIGNITNRLDYISTVLKVAGVLRYVWGETYNGENIILSSHNGNENYTEYSPSTRIRRIKIANTYLTNKQGELKLLPPSISIDGISNAISKIEEYTLPKPAYKNLEYLNDFCYSLAPNIYLGSGLYSFKVEGETRLAIGNGNWSSPQSVTDILSLVKTLVEKGNIDPKVAAGAAGGVAAIFGGIATVMDYGDDDENQLRDCYTNSGSIAECQSCVSGSEAQTINALQAAGSASGLVSSVLAASAAATGVGLAVAIVFFAVAAINLANEVHQSARNMTMCDRNYR